MPPPSGSRSTAPKEVSRSSRARRTRIGPDAGDGHHRQSSQYALQGLGLSLGHTVPLQPRRCGVRSKPGNTTEMRRGQLVVAALASVRSLSAYSVRRLAAGGSAGSGAWPKPPSRITVATQRVDARLRPPGTERQCVPRLQPAKAQHPWPASSVHSRRIAGRRCSWRPLTASSPPWSGSHRRAVLTARSSGGGVLLSFCGGPSLAPAGPSFARSWVSTSLPRFQEGPGYAADLPVRAL